MDGKVYNTGKQETLLQLTTEKNICVKTDQMLVNTTLKNSAESYEKASALAEKELGQMIQIMTEFGVNEESIKNTLLKITPEDYCYEGEELGYSYQLEMDITIPLSIHIAQQLKDKLESLSASVDIYFKLYLENPQEEREKALKEAISENREKAKCIARQLNKAVWGIKTITYGVEEEETKDLWLNKVPIRPIRRIYKGNVYYSGRANEKQYYQELAEGNIYIKEKIYIEWLLV